MNNLDFYSIVNGMPESANPVMERFRCAAIRLHESAIESQTLLKPQFRDDPCQGVAITADEMITQWEEINQIQGFLLETAHENNMVEVTPILTAAVKDLTEHFTWIFKKVYELLQHHTTLIKAIPEPDERSLSLLLMNQAALKRGAHLVAPPDSQRKRLIALLSDFGLPVAQHGNDIYLVSAYTPTTVWTFDEAGNFLYVKSQ